MILLLLTEMSVLQFDWIPRFHGDFEPLVFTDLDLKRLVDEGWEQWLYNK